MAREIKIIRESKGQSAPILSSRRDSSNSDMRDTKIEDFLKDVSIRAFNICVVSCNNKDDAHDIVQNSMCKLVEKYKHNPSNQWKPLFYTILRNKLNDYYRKKALSNRIFASRNTDEEYEETVSYSPNPSDQSNNPQKSIETMERRSALKSALSILPRRQQQAFMFRYWEGFSTRETALAMNCSEGSVKTHLSRANERLRELLKGIYDD
ncbi:MAG: RNA polymerase sigma factor [Porticoccaceae bacterium]|nr:RNA polymerase sigma factor [Porticoccaceae bacterium]